MLRARCRPQREEVVVGIGEGPTAANRHQAGVTDFGKITVGTRSYVSPRSQEAPGATPETMPASSPSQLLEAGLTLLPAHQLPSLPVWIGGGLPRVTGGARDVHRCPAEVACRLAGRWLWCAGWRGGRAPVRHR